MEQVFSCEFCEISKNTFFMEHLWWLLLLVFQLNLLTFISLFQLSRLFLLLYRAYLCRIKLLPCKIFVGKHFRYLTKKPSPVLDEKFCPTSILSVLKLLCRFHHLNNGKNSLLWKMEVTMIFCGDRLCVKLVWSKLSNPLNPQ